MTPLAPEPEGASPLTPHPSRPAFIVFEGPEGSGKSTQIRLLAERLRHRGYEPLLTREPGGTPVGDAIRGVLLDPNLSMTAMSEFLLYSASRAEHVQQVIKPALEQGKVVISDRFFGASVAYQGYGRGLELPFVESLSERVTGGLRADVTVLLDLDPAKGLARVAARGAKDRLERADLNFHRRVHEGFLAQASEDASWVTLDAEQPEDALSEAVWQVLCERFEF